MYEFLRIQYVLGNLTPEPGEVDIEKYREAEQMTFTDAHLIADWAKDAVEYCVEHGLMQGTGEKFDPKGAVTRQELAVVLKRILEG